MNRDLDDVDRSVFTTSDRELKYHSVNHKKSYGKNAYILLGYRHLSRIGSSRWHEGPISSCSEFGPPSLPVTQPPLAAGRAAWEAGAG